MELLKERQEDVYVDIQGGREGTKAGSQGFRETGVSARQAMIVASAVSGWPSCPRQELGGRKHYSHHFRDASV